MKTCAYCNKENDDAATRCVECGTEDFKSAATAPTTFESQISARGLWIVFRFLAFGVVGFFVCTFFSAMAYFSIVPFFLELPYIVLGLLMIFFGVGRWGQWGYLFVFGSPLFAIFVLPGLVHLVIKNEALEVLLFFVFLFILPFIVLVPVRRHYQNRSVRKDKSSQHEAAP